MAPADRAHPAERELVAMDTTSIFRWFSHGFPHPLARWHHHPEIEIHLIRDSHGAAHIGRSVRVFGPGSLYLLGADLAHNWVSVLEDRSEVPDRDVLVHADPQLLAKAETLLPELTGLRAFLETARAGIEFTGDTRDRATEALTAMGGSTGPARLALGIELLGILMAAPPEEREIVDPEAPAEAGPRGGEDFDRALEFLHRNLRREVRLEDLARELGMSTSAASRMLTRATTVGFSRLMSRMRVTEACRLLRSTRLSVVDVCWASGFRNLSNFNRRFREETGTTPSAYRRSLG
ncbi:AraC family transcriptional regulator [Rothia kristinae]